MIIDNRRRVKWKIDFITWLMIRVHLGSTCLAKAYVSWVATNCQLSRASHWHWQRKGKSAHSNHWLDSDVMSTSSSVSETINTMSANINQLARLKSHIVISWFFSLQTFIGKHNRIFHFSFFGDLFSFLFFVSLRVSFASSLIIGSSSKNW